MNEILNDVVNGRWMRKPSPFRCTLQNGNSKLCVITGPNVSGKSLLRKILHNRYADKKITYVNLSQEGRSTSGIQRAFLYGTEQDDSTGWNSIKSLLTAIRSGQGYTDPFVIMLDEPEIGCSEEVQAAMGDRIVRDLGTMPQLQTMYIITHSREMVKHLLPLNPAHLRLSEDGITLEQYITREVTPVTLEDIIESGRINWQAVKSMIKNRG